MLEVIVNKGVKKLILGIQRNREKFSTYSKQNLNYDEMTMIVKIFGKACQEHEISKRNDVIKIFLHDTFIENLGEFLVNCLNQPQKTYNVISTSVLEHVLNICEAVCCFDANHSALQTILKSITTLTPAFEKGRYNKYSKQIREKVRALSSKVDLTGKGDNQNTKCLESNYGRGVCDLNESQMAAFQAATTQKFTIIRGPPATGKTHLGLQIVKTFLDRKHLWHKRTPILIVCSSDGALDTILEGVATFTSKILRVGGHLKNTRLSRFTLQDLSKREQNVAAEVKTINEKLEEIDDCRGILGFNEFAEVTPHTWFYNAGDDQILQWLLANKESGSNVQKKKTWSKISFSTPERGTRAIVSLKCLQQEINRLEQTTRKQKRQLNKKLSHLKDKHKILTERLAEGKRFKDVADQRPTNTNLTNPEEMQPDDRWKLYFYWLKLYQNELMRKLASFQNKKNDKIDYAVAEIMKDALVVGVTAAKAVALRSSLFSLKSPIVIVEDAADISEAQIVTGMVKHCQHLILFGDHRPTTDDSNSLFERIDSDLSQHYVLNVQYRMRPEISSLLSTVYPSLKDHHSVTARAPVKGMDKCLFFLDRDSDSEITTIRTGKINCEIELFVCLAKYLVSNGYKSKRIAIVAACLGQMDEFRNAIRKHGDLQGVRISDLGNYQAGENEIILLYLMPSSGILLSDRRICFTISRARSGLYVMGNMKQLCHDNEFWVDIKATLQELSAIGQELPLKPLSCIHGQNTVSYVKSAADFIAVSQKSCDKKCEIMPPCGHQCNRLCHVQDVAHAEYKCKEICGR
ncbi:AAA 12 domain containing protein [Asbolus verrucosus]|uniref:AAA 12 domain containing protein n=1 Tax=Asbolus verrucosus TaxID=1661398 RepID=A0A482VH87_ASBVE|nr:AAA 12 domain containing protein [Asbolus verrucosus]